MAVDEQPDAEPSSRQIKRCKICREPGHRAPRCPKQPPVASMPQEKQDTLAEIAATRERIDALKIEIKQYEEVRRNVEQRLIDDRVRLAQAEEKLAELRRRR